MRSDISPFAVIDGVDPQFILFNSTAFLDARVKTAHDGTNHCHGVSFVLEALIAASRVSIAGAGNTLGHMD